MNRTQKTIVLWLMTMGGLACHSMTDLLPLFWSQPVAISDSGAAPQAMLIMMACLSLLIPVAGILCLLYGEKFRACLLTNAVLACLIGLFNIVHAFMELPADNHAQYLIMPLLIVVGLLLVWESVRLLARPAANTAADGE